MFIIGKNSLLTYAEFDCVTFSNNIIIKHILYLFVFYEGCQLLLFSTFFEHAFLLLSSVVHQETIIKCQFRTFFNIQTNFSHSIFISEFLRDDNYNLASFTQLLYLTIYMQIRQTIQQYETETDRMSLSPSYNNMVECRMNALQIRNS